ncbi:flagellar hook-associated protein FlgK, partial [Rugamonas sp.]|uniref:flagellar hook-associated protein FlgK n=1 Tax=Rugamonas sp. TaxID=1926287 RepID=UPI0025CF34E4
ALNTTSQNIANSQTDGYTRQGTLLSAVGPAAGGGDAGNGVTVTSLIRFSDDYKNQQLWRSNSDLGARTQTQPYLTQMEQVLGDDKSGISAGVDQFFAALNAAGVDPTSTPLRQQVITAANAMSQHFNSVYNVTTTQVLSVNQQRSAAIPQINQITASVAALNQQIVAANATGSNSSALVDQRDGQIDKLASLVGIEVTNQNDGSRSVSLTAGQPLVDGNLAATMTLNNTVGGSPTLHLTFGKSGFQVDDTQVGGQLGGLSNYLKGTLLPLQQSISDLAGQLSAKVNTQFAAGFDSAGNPGQALLQFNPASASGLLQVVPGLTSSQLAFSGDGTPGDTTNLQALIGIDKQNVTLTSIGTVLIGDADTQLVGKLGIDSQQNHALLGTATTIRQQAEDDWKSTSGVNSDEEAINLVAYQNMYQANMKVIAVANTLFDATLQMFG